MPPDGKPHTTITVPETVYEMLKVREIPNLRRARRFIISREAYTHWEATIGQGPVRDIHETPSVLCNRPPRRMNH